MSDRQLSFVLYICALMSGYLLGELGASTPIAVAVIAATSAIAYIILKRRNGR
jgi:hypothetical protein